MVTRIVSIGAILVASISVVAATEEDKFPTFPQDRNWEALIRQLRPALEPVDGAARVYAVVDCQGTAATRFPQITLQSPSKNKTGVDAVREIFGKDKRTTVTTDATGMPRIKFGKSPCALLQTKIHRLQFTTRQRYNIIEAEEAIENTKEVKASIRRLGLQQPIVVISENVQEPMEGVPHLPASIKDVTMDQALDLLAKTFASVVFYEECIDAKGVRFFSVNQGCIVCGPWRHTPREASRLNVPLVK
jgi:hypothetical protein